MNLPNKLTFARIISVAIFIPFLSLGYYQTALIVFALSCLTDFLDGYIARKYNLITNLGKFLDPLADKILVLSALVCLVELKMVAAWAVCIIITREFAVTGVRLAALSSENKPSSESAVIAAGWLGKIKTASTMVAICIILAFETVFLYISKPNNVDTQLIYDVLIYISVFFTAWSGIDYFIKYGWALKE